MEKVATLIILFVFLVRVSPGQPFSLDTTFMPTYAFVDDENKNYTGFISDLYEESDGRITLAGGFSDVPKTNRSRWVRLQPDGNLDYSWTPAQPSVWGYSFVTRVNEQYYFGNHRGIVAVNQVGALLPEYELPIDSGFNCGAVGSPYVFEDGSFLAGIGGCPYPHSGDVQRVINFMRVGSDGYVDTSFHHNANSTVGWTYPYDSTRILCYGNWVTEYDGFPVNRVFRIYKDGTLDTTFNAPSGFSRMGYPIHVQDDGKVILGWNYALIGADTLTLFRLHPNGDFDSTFNFQSSLKHSYWPTGTVVSACATSDGGYLFGGAFEEYGGYNRTNIVKTDHDGFVDTLYFNGAGIDSVKSGLGFPPGVNKIVSGQNDTYYVMGQFLMFDGQPVKPIIRLLGLSHTVSVEEEVIPNFLTVFPNPSDGQLTFSLNQNHVGRPWEIRLFDIQGRLLDSREVSSSVSEQSVDLVDGNGIMIYEVEMDLRVQRGRVVLR